MSIGSKVGQCLSSQCDKTDTTLRKGFSDTDIRKLNTLYKCKGYPQVSAHIAKTQESFQNKSFLRSEARDP